jgi:hypothetical protein
MTVDVLEPVTRAVAMSPRQTLLSWANDANMVYDVARRIATTSFAPLAFRGKPEEITAAILAGAELGFDPMAALRSINVINGTPALSAMAQRAVLQSRGHTLLVVESTQTRALVRGRRADGGDWQESLWTIDRAKQMGLAGKENWRNQPTAMLVARATAECARLVAADALLGMPYAVEELADGGASAPDTPPPAVAHGATAVRTVRRAPKVAEPGPVAPPPETAPDAPVAAEPAPGEGITLEQSVALHARLRESGLGERAAGLRYIGTVIGRPVGSTKELTIGEAAAALDALAADPDEWPPVAEPGAGA